MSVFNIKILKFNCPETSILIGNFDPCYVEIQFESVEGLEDYKLYVNDSLVNIEPTYDSIANLYTFRYKTNNTGLTYNFQVKATCITTQGIVNSNIIEHNSNKLAVDTEIYAFFDNTSMSYQDGLDASTALNDWFEEYKSNNPSYIGNLWIIPIVDEKYLYYSRIIEIGASSAAKNNPDRPNDLFYPNIANLPPNFDTTNDELNPNWEKPDNVLILAFVDEVEYEYHSNEVSFIEPNSFAAIPGKKTTTISKYQFNGLDDSKDIYITEVSITGILSTFEYFKISKSLSSNNLDYTLECIKPIVLRNLTLTIRLKATDGTSSQTITRYPMYQDYPFLKNNLQPTQDFQNDYISYMKSKENFKSLKCVLYPIIRDIDGQGGALTLQAIGALKGRVLTQDETDAIDTPVNLMSIRNNNPYENFTLSNGEKLQPLENVGWVGIFNKLSPASDVFNSDTFSSELNEIITNNNAQCD